MDSCSKRIEKEKWEVEKLEEKVRLGDKRRHELEEEIHQMKFKHKTMEEDFEAVNKVKKELETELKHLLKLVSFAFFPEFLFLLINLY